MEKGIGDRFQQETAYRRDHLPAGTLQWSKKPEAFKRYPEKLKFALPAPKTQGGGPLWDVLGRRRSVRDFRPDPVSLEEVSQLLWAAQGITAHQFGYALRTAPSAGALYPVETYLVAHRVLGLPQGLYHYAVLDHGLEQIAAGDFRVAAARAALDQKVAYEAALVLVWTAVFERCKWKYRQRAYRYIYLDAGHIAQNVALAAVALDLGSCQIGALYDDEVNDLVGADGVSEGALYLTVVGRPA